MFDTILKDDFLYSCSNVDCTFYIRTDDMAFPDNEWTDFAVTVIGWWLHLLINHRKCHKAKFDLLFMDGPYYIECEKDDDYINMKFISYRSKKVIIREMTFPYYIVLQKVYFAGENILDMLKQHDIYDKVSDVPYLADLCRLVEPWQKSMC